LLFIFIKLFIQNQRRKKLLSPWKFRKMTENINEITTTTTTSSRMATRSTTAAAAAATTTITTTTAGRTTNTKTGHERLSQLYPHITDDVHLPMKWSGKEKASTLVLQHNDLVVTYRGR
jgi:hypothetical protein